MGGSLGTGAAGLLALAASIRVRFIASALPAKLKRATVYAPFDKGNANPITSAFLLASNTRLKGTSI